jgi:hypothetical protein
MGTPVYVSGVRYSPSTDRLEPYGFTGTLVGRHAPTGRPLVATAKGHRVVVGTQETWTAMH